MLWDAARKNREFIIIHVNPNAKSIYENKLRFYDKDLKIPSSIEGRICFLPYKFGEVLPLLKNLYVRRLREVRPHEQNLLESERQGKTPTWDTCLEKYAECEFASKVNFLLQSKVDWNELSWHTKSKCSFNMLIHSASTGDDQTTLWADRVNELLETFSVNNIFISLETDLLALRVYLQKEESRTRNITNITDMSKIFLERYNVKKDHLPKQARQIIKPFIDQLSRFLERCRSVDQKELSRYIEEMKKNYSSEIEKLQSLHQKAHVKAMEEIVTQIERKEFEKIFGGKSIKISIN